MALERDLVATAISALRDLPRAPYADTPVTELLALLDGLGRARRLIDASVAMIAAELDSGDGPGSVALRLGERSTADVLAGRMGATTAESRAWCAAAASLAPRLSLLGQLLPARWSHLSEALLDGDLPIAKANVAATALESVIGLLGVPEAERLEVELVRWAESLGDRDFGRLCRTLPDRVDADGAGFREQQLRDRAGLTMGRTADGMSRWVLTLDPESEGMLRAALDARTAPRRSPRFDTDDEVGDPVDPRMLPQRRLDALVDIARTSLLRDDGDLAGTAVTMVVTVSERALRTGLGAATIAGVETAIGAGTARRLAAQAEIIPLVLGGESEVLDLGRGRRLYSGAQRRALAFRDKGCIWAGCPAPPAWCEIAHLKPWSLGGPTDLDNAALMCASHHRRFDLDGWELITQHGVRRLVPPAHIDAARTPRRTGPLPSAA